MERDVTRAGELAVPYQDPEHKRLFEDECSCNVLAQQGSRQTRRLSLRFCRSGRLREKEKVEGVKMCRME